mgnify:CR=1 FL=1
MANTATVIAHRLRGLAAAMTAPIAQKFPAPTGAQRLTRRRLELIEHAERQGWHLQKVQAALLALAEGHEQGTVPPCLATMTTRAAVEALVRDPTASAASVALQALLPASVGQPTLAQRIARLEREVLWLRLPGFFPTPAPVAERLLDVAHIAPGMSVLEPSAGTGTLADAIRCRCPTATVSVIEWQHSLVEVLQLKGYEVLSRDFLTFPSPEQMPARFDRLVMNPPFEQEQDIAHVRHATSLLRPGGRVVAIVSEGAFVRQSRTAQAFCQWLAEQSSVTEAVPAGAFAQTGRPTAVRCRIVVIEAAPGSFSPRMTKTPCLQETGDAARTA